MEIKISFNYPVSDNTNDGSLKITSGTPILANSINTSTYAGTNLSTHYFIFFNFDLSINVIGPINYGTHLSLPKMF